MYLNIFLDLRIAIWLNLLCLLSIAKYFELLLPFFLVLPTKFSF